jgi:putative flippase GtrA
VQRAETGRRAAITAAVRALWRHRLVRYVVAGSVNTGISQLCYLALLRTGLTPGVAFACAFAVGIAIGYLLHSRIVFNATPRHVHWLSFPAACVARLVASEWLLYALIDHGVTAGWAGLFANVAMVPVGYLLTKLALRSPARSRA